MDNRIEDIIEKIKKLEQELYLEVQKKEAEFYYKISGQKVRFEQEIRKQHKIFKLRLSRYLIEAPFLNVLSAPIIWCILIPALFLDLAVTVYQFVCFPIYGIPRVKRGRYIVIDRHALSYLNIVEKFNCVYCGYFNGLMAYVREIAGRTEQYWCPIKHARRIAFMHSRYVKFFEYGDAEGYRRHLEEVRRDFADLQDEEGEG